MAVPEGLQKVIQNSDRFGILPGRLEDEDLVINDVYLRLPPESIHVDKQAFNHEWETIRTGMTQRSKSGYSTARVSFTMEFRVGSSFDSPDLQSLMNLVAGLRATPFCVVYNKYIEQTLGQPEDSDITKTANSYKKFRPIMLGLSSMVFSTMGHMGKPDCVQGTFDFLWFNYLPYTPIIAFKTGDNFNTPGTPGQSLLWKAFYSPLVPNAYLKFPHDRDPVSQRPPTIFNWKEYLTVSKGSSATLEASIKLLNALRGKPEKSMASLQSVIQGAFSENKPETITGGIYDTWFRKMVQEGTIDADSALQEELKKTPGSISTVSGEILQPLVKQMGTVNQGGQFSQNILQQIDIAGGILAERLKRLKEVGKNNTATGGPIADGYTSMLEGTFKDSSTGNTPSYSSSLQLFGRTRSYTIPAHGAERDPQIIIQAITVSFENSLAVIPVLGYRYPTLQHLGHCEGRVSMMLNVKNGRTNKRSFLTTDLSSLSGLEAIHHIYDTVETMALRFKQIPAGFNNLTIKNDFLGIFGLEEFVTEQISSDTIPDQPGRSLISLSLVEGGITSKNRLQNPEQLKQEFLRGSESITKEIWNVIKGHIVWPRAELKSSLLGPSAATREVAKYFCSANGVPQDTAHQGIKDIVNQAVTNINTYIKALQGYVFQKFYPEEPLSTINNIGFDQLIYSKNTYNRWSVALTIKENDPDFGFIPAWEEIRKGLAEEGQRLKLEVPKGQKNSELTGLPQTNTISQMKEKEKAAAIAKGLITGDTPNLDSMADTRLYMMRTIGNTGLDRYKTEMTKLISTIRQEYIDLPEFKKIALMLEQQGISKGLITYPDFRDSLGSIAGLVEGLDKSSDTQLMKYDPDCYFWYPAYDGGQASPNMGLVDPYYITEAKLHSLELWRNAQSKVGEFFSTRYMEILGKKSLPYKALISNGASKLIEPLYGSIGSEQQYKNSASQKPIQKDVATDAEIKLPSNWYTLDSSGSVDVKLLSITGPQQACGHTASFEDMWQGVNPETMKSAATIAAEEGPDTQLGIAANNAKRGNYPKAWDSMDPPVRKLFQQLWDELRNRNWDPIDIRGQEHFASWIPPGRAVDVCHRGHAPWLGKSKTERQKIKDDSSIISWYFPSDPVCRFYKDVEEIVKSLGTRMKTCYWGGWAQSYAQATKDMKKSAAWRNRMGSSGWASRWMGTNDKYPEAKQVITKYWGANGANGIGGVGDMMHVEFRSSGKENVQRRQPNQVGQQRIDKLNATTPGKDVTSTITSPLMSAIRELERSMIKGQGQGMMRAYPTYKLYFIEDDSGERKRLGFDDFFSYNAVQSIRVVRSRKIAADLCEIYVTNVSGILSNRKFRQKEYGERPSKTERPHTATGEVTAETKDPLLADTSKENPIASLMLQEGMDIQVRMGNSNDPDELDEVFNGKIMEVEFAESDDLIRIIAQTHAVELVQDIKGIQKPIKKSARTIFGWTFWGFSESATTGRILESMLAEPEVLHFGRWTPRKGGATVNRDILTSRWTFTPQPQDDNVFAPSAEYELSSFGDGWSPKLLERNLKYIIYRTTIWDIMQELTLRNPNFICSPVPYQDRYGPRMTLFFGLPNQLYFARYPTATEQDADNKLRGIPTGAAKPLSQTANYSLNRTDSLRQALGSSLWGTVTSLLKAPVAMTMVPGAAVSGDWSYFSKTDVAILSAAARGILRAPIAASTFLAGNKFWNPEEYVPNVTSRSAKLNRLELALGAGYIKPFRNYHLITSSQHIIANNIKASSRDVANTIHIKYGKDVKITDSSTGKGIEGTRITGDDQEFTLKLDCALPTEEIRTQMGQFINVTNPNLAKRYALGLLLRNLKEIYKGELIILGNGKIKPYDIVYLMDEYSDMIGAFEVEEVQHIMDREHGFRTEIKPDMLCAAAEWSLISSAEALGVVCEGLLRQGEKTTKGLNLGARIAGYGMNLFGGFMADKIINYTQLAQPVIMSPLLHHGRPFAGGVPTRKIPTSVWSTIFRKWQPAIDTGYNAWFEDIKDQMEGWVTKAFGGYTVGQFPLGHGRSK